MNKSSIIIGINTYHTDSAACIIVDGNLIAAFEEERINRIKHYAGFPINSIQECLKIANLNSNQITDVAFNTRPLSNLVHKSIYFLKNFSMKKSPHMERLKKKYNLKKILKEKINLNDNVKFHYVEHHLAHIASAFYPSSFNEACGISIDGSGDFVSIAYAECKNYKIKIKKKNYFPDSLGIFYHAMTQFLGFKNYGDEYKMMGLAAYGKPIYYDKILTNLFDKKNEIKLNLDYFNHHKNNFKYIAKEQIEVGQIYSEKLTQLFSNELKDHQFKSNFASSVQKVYENFFKKILNQIKRKNFSKNLVFSGGCALNSSANRLLTIDNSFFENIFINCAPGDNGGALGAAFTVAANTSKKFKNFSNPYLGQKYSNVQIDKILLKEIYKNKIKKSYLDDDSNLFDTTAKLISEGKVVGWFQENMEFGPRALGNRSILADPRNPNMKDIINMKIKRRESFRPFAPSVLSEFQADWFNSSFSSYYMSTLAFIPKEKQKLIPAVTHVDKTARYQTVNKNSNYRFYKLIESFNKITNVPILLNTSFNENEPIVMKPEEALDCLIRTDMDALIIGNFIITKK